MRFFSPSISRKAIRSMKRKRKEVVTWYSRQKMYHVVQCEKHGHKIPMITLYWERDRHPKAQMKESRRDKMASFIFWDRQVCDADACIRSIKIPELCISCGSSNDLEAQKMDPFSVLISDLVNTGRTYSLEPKPTFTLNVCQGCRDEMAASSKSLWQICRCGVKFNEDGPFLLIRMDIKPPQTYAALVEANASHIVPEFELLSWQQVVSQPTSWLKENL